MIVADIAARVRGRLPDTAVTRGEVTSIVQRDELLATMAWLMDEPELEFGFLSSVTATDWPGREPRMWVSYELRSMTMKHRIRLKVGVSDGDLVVPSVTLLFPTANWHEREVYDMFGVTFEGHPDMTRILMPDDWVGHPLQKTEELGGVNTRYHGAFIPPVDTRNAP